MNQPRLAHTRRLSLPFTLLLIAALLLAGLTPAAQVAAQSTPPPAGASSERPALLTVTPAAGSAWAGEPVVWTFDRPVDAEALSILPELAGEWLVSENTITLTPAETPAPGERYRLRFSVAALNSEGLPAGAGVPVELLLTGAVPLEVTATTPTDGAIDISPGSVIVVTFNRPIVPLVGVDEQAGLPQPLTIEPAVEGTGTWLTSSIYSFEPAGGLAGATDYTVTVGELTAVGGETLAAGFSFGFSTSAPVVETAWPQGRAAPGEAVRVFFTQPMEPTSAEAAFSLTAESGEEVEGAFTWGELGTQLTFTPTVELARGGSYTIAVDMSAQPAAGVGGMRDAFSSTFTVAPLPAVERTTPADGSTNVLPDQQVVIRFTTPLSTATLLPNVTISPMLTTTSVYSWFNEWEGELTLEWNKQAHTTYTVSVGAGAEDLYGVAMEEPYTFSFTTGDFSPFVRLDLDNFTHFTPYTDTNVSLFYRNVDQLDVSLYTLPLDDLLESFVGPNYWDVWNSYQPDEAGLLWSRTYTATEVRNETYQRVITLDDGEGNILPPGLYVVETQQPEGTLVDPGMTQQARTIDVVAISSNALVLKKSVGGDSLAWVTDAQSGEGVAGAEVNFGYTGGAVATATTDADGVATALVEASADVLYLPMVAWTGEPGNADFALASSDWSTGIAPWDFNITGYTPEAVNSLFYTDRPLYQPGQTVHWRGIVRKLVNDSFEIPDPSEAMTITVRNDRGDAILTQQVQFGEFGTLSGDVLLPPDSFSGSYYLEALLPLPNNQMHYGFASFLVASYAKPEFEVRVLPEADEVTQGGTVRVRIEADYYSGGALANAPLAWNIIANPYAFDWEDAPQGRWFSFTPWDPDQDEYDPYAMSLLGLVKEGKGVTDDEGVFVLELPADLGAALQSQEWTVSATVQSPTNQFVYGSGKVIVHRGAFYVGLSPQSYVAAVGADANVDVVALTPEGEPVAGQELEATIYEFRWNNVQEQTATGSFVWTSTAERTPVDTAQLTTGDDGMAVLSFSPPRGGQYQVVVEGEDEGGNRIGSALFLWVSNPDPSGYTPWQRENNDRIELVADRRSYQPGDTAQILVPSPFQGEVQALVTIERTGVVEHRLVTLTGNSETIEVPIFEEHVPNIYVGVVLVKGIDETNPAPAIRIGYVQLDVGIETKQLTIDVEVESSTGGEDEQPTAEPGETVTYTIDVADFAGEPVAGAELSVAIVDKALLALATQNGATLADAFYRTRPLGVTTGATLVINRDRMAQQLSDGAKGGGGGDGGGMFEVRDEFPDTAFWQADLVSDENGRITFSLELPDNLTTWSLSARGVTADTLVGETTHELVVTKTLQVRPLLPRFFTAGDRAQLGALVLNTRGEALSSATFTVTVEGATLEGDAVQALDFGAAGDEPSSRVDFALSVPTTSDAVTVTMAALVEGEEGLLGDGVRRVLPVVRATTPEVVGTAGTVAGTSVTEWVQVPASAGDEGSLIVGVEPSLAAGMTEGLDYLRHFPYECTEQTVSRFLPNVFTARAVEALELETLDLVSSELVGNLDEALGTGVQALVARQNADGGWGNWPGEASNRFVTAYALWGLVEARAQGMAVPDFTIDRAVDYLDRTFIAPDDLADTPGGQSTLNTLAFVHFVLAEIGEADPGRMSTLYDVRERLDHYGRALLAMALADEDPADARVQTLLDDLAGAAVRTGTAAWWQEESLDLAAMNTDVRTTAIVLDAFSRLRPQEEMLPNVVRWLMQARAAGIWSNTQENAWALIGLTDWMVASGELEADYSWEVTLNGAALGAGEANAAALANLGRVELRAAVADLLRDQPNAVALARSNESGQMNYTLHLESFVDALALGADDRGVVVDRTFNLNGAPVTSAQVGDIISVTVTVVAPTLLHQLAVEVPIPAGTEIIDPNLVGGRVYDRYGMIIEQPGWKAWRPTYRDYRNDRIALFDTVLNPGTWQYTFQVRATVPGEFRVLPARAEMLYFREVWGRSAGALFTVTE